MYQPYWIAFCIITNRPLEWQENDSNSDFIHWINQQHIDFKSQKRKKGINPDYFSRKEYEEKFLKWLNK
jgi:hypothetical protein